MSLFQRIIAEGDLIDYKFNKDNIQTVVSELLNMIEKQQETINNINDRLETYATKTATEYLSEQISNCLKEQSKFMEDINKKVDDESKQLNENMKQLRDWTEESNSSTLVDVRRYLSTELEDLINQQQQQQPKEQEKPQQPTKIIERQVGNDDSARINHQISQLQIKIDNLESLTSNLPSQDSVRRQIESVSNYSEDIMDHNIRLNNLEGNIPQLNDIIKSHSKYIENHSGVPTPRLVEEPKPTQTSAATNPEPNTPIKLRIDSTNRSFITTPSMSIFSISAMSTPKKEPLQPGMQTPIVIGGDNSEIERVVRRQNDTVSSIRLVADGLVDRFNQFENKYNQFVAQIGMKNLEYSQTLDQIQAQLGRVPEMISKDPAFNKLFDPYKTKIQTLNERVTSLETKHAPVHSALYEMLAKDPPSQPQTPPEPTEADVQMDNSIKSGNATSFREKTFSTSTNHKVIDIERTSPKLEISDEDKPVQFAPHTIDIPKQSKETTQIKIIHKSDRKSAELLAALQNAQAQPSISQDEIQERVDAAIRNTLTGFIDRVKKTVAEQIEEGIKPIHKVQAMIETKIDRDFVERIFNKFRVLIGELKDRVDNFQMNFQNWITREELEEVLNRFSTTLQEVKDTAGTSSKYKCLLCGRPRTHLAGMIVSSPRDEDDENSSTGSEKEAETPKRASTAKSKSRLPKAPNSIRRPVSHAMPRDIVQLFTGREKN
ncbi:hypothetical protein TVAG_132570 [Trichomonas vaginalis G3]|uniref:Uncharacterized protein n=1 Tax=Trichomonas vaginalis (strain ATCC PRA-98 / G3) TaxID=412133 RepID=A2FS96_TRIV3|nr:hypothetical protein TVAGG3_0210230 [Trichomonas vaginalis G3]EAX92212.1 hypothetical protein TVAG_132570 [Trichomonas vaginalis G3]KAI5551184.1 hypothetical protein TVAGG3_0210230 [Trichomonas vaginalis G3]|eukprot:XP_001305142.1 hypothetical protein [Trichomonas vaginalis G3]